MIAAAEPEMRVTNIALGYNEVPREITLIANTPVAERINGYMGGPSVTAGEPLTLPVRHAARIAKHFRDLPTPDLPTPDQVATEIWSCLTEAVFNRFWDGLDEYWSQQR